MYPLKEEEQDLNTSFGSLFSQDISESEMETLYANAYHFYQDGMYDKAIKFFEFLVILNPLAQKYRMGMAAALQMADNHDEALKSYAIASMLNADDPYPHFHAAECYIALGNNEEASKALNCAAENANFGNWYDGQLLKRIALLKGRCNKTNNDREV